MKLTWGQFLGKPECYYMKRWVADLGPISFRIHKWLSSDDQRNFHDHPWGFISLVLKGSYVDKSEHGDLIRKPGDINYFPATHKHTVQVAPEGCWTLVITGREKRKWGFHIKQKDGTIKFKHRNRYFYDYGHHPCE